MIKNHSTLRVQDIDFINALLRKRPALIAVRILAVLFAGYMLFYTGLIFYTQLRWHNAGAVELIVACVFLVMGLLLLHRAIFLKRVSRRTSMKHPSLFAERTYLCDETGIASQYSFEGEAHTNSFPYEKAACYYAREDSVVIRFRGENKQQIYMILRDDGYTEGSRAELLQLLESKHIRDFQKKAPHS